MPYLFSKSRQSSVSLAATNPEVHKPISRVKALASSPNEVEVPISEDEPFSSPDDDEYEDDEPAIVGGNVFQPEDDDDLFLTFQVIWEPMRQKLYLASLLTGRSCLLMNRHRRGLASGSGNGEEKWRKRGKAALKSEAKSKRHMLTHIPKNPYCEVCNRPRYISHRHMPRVVHQCLRQRSSGIM